MIITRNIEVPTGNILIVKGDLGELECLSLGDYGKDVNIKADFLGLDREPSPVRHTSLLPLGEKWVITISTQYGCSMNCQFCDVPVVGPGRNATLNDLVGQVSMARNLRQDVTTCRHMNIHFARMGEPTWNPNVIHAAKILKYAFGFSVHPVVSTMMPKNNRWLESFLGAWMQIKNEYYNGNAGLQLSINSTNSFEREKMFSGNSLSLEEMRKIMIGLKPKGRKITLNFAVAGWEIDPDVLLEYFDPDDYIIKLTPMHKTRAALEQGIRTEGDYTGYYPYQADEKALRNAGYDVLVFIASAEEDSGRITCGNAILSGTKPECKYAEVYP